MNVNRLAILILTMLSAILSYLILEAVFLAVEQTEEDLILGSLLAIFSFVRRFTLLGLGVIALVQLIQTKHYWFSLPLVISITTFTIVLIVWRKVEAREASPIVLLAHHEGGTNGITLMLRENKTYKLKDYGPFGGTNHFGRYAIIGDTIFLSKKYPMGADRYLLDNKLVLTSDFILIKAGANGIYDENDPFRLKIVEHSLDQMKTDR